MNTAYQSGLIALVSAIVIAALLLILTFTLSLSGYFGRFTLLNAEYKERSLGLAEACGDEALYKLAQDSSYDPTTDPNHGVVMVGTDSCTIKSVQQNTPPGDVTIKTTALFQNITTNLQVVADSSALTIISWLETP